MAAPTTVKIRGYVRNSVGTPYEGAVIRVYAQYQMNASSSLIGNEIATLFSDIYGKFELNLVPTSSDLVHENYYLFYIIKDNTTVYKKMVPEVPTTDQPIEFDALPDYLAPSQRTPLLGNLNKTISTTPVQLPSDLVGIFKWEPFIADGTQTIFTAPGDIYLVAVNGQLQTENADFMFLNTKSVQFYTAPNNGDTVTLQYRI